LSIKKQISSTFATRIATIFLTFATSVFLTRLLGVEGKGEFTIFTASLGLFGLLFSFGSRPAIIYYGAKKELNLSKLVSTAILFSLIVGLAFFLLMNIIQSNFEKSIFLHKNRSSLYYQVLITICLTLAMFSSQLKAIFNSQKKISFLNLFQVIAACLGILIYGLMFFGRNKYWHISIDTIFTVFTIISFLNFIIVTFFFIKEFKIFPSLSLLSKNDLLKLVSFASLAYFGNIAQFLNYRIDLWLVDYYSGARELGIYSLSASLAQMLWILPQSIALVLFPYFASNSDQILEKTLFISRITLISCIAVTIISFFTLEPIIVLLYGIEFTASALLFNILLIGVLPFSLTVIFGSYFSGIGRQEINLKAAFIGLVATIVLDYLWIPVYGNIGAAIATSCSYIITTTYILYNVLKLSGEKIHRIFFLDKNDIQFIRQKLIKT